MPRASDGKCRCCVVGVMLHLLFVYQRRHAQLTSLLVLDRELELNSRYDVPDKNFRSLNGKSNCTVMDNVPADLGVF